jgi:hypothetical protein
MPHDVLSVILDQLSFANPNGLKRRFKLGDTVEVLR